MLSSESRFGSLWAFGTSSMEIERQVDQTITLCAVDDEFSAAVVTRADELTEAFGDDLVVLHVMTRERFDPAPRASPSTTLTKGR